MRLISYIMFHIKCISMLELILSATITYIISINWQFTIAHA